MAGMERWKSRVWAAFAEFTLWHNLSYVLRTILAALLEESEKCGGRENREANQEATVIRV